VDEKKGLRTGTAYVRAKTGAMPVDLSRIAGAHVERAVAVAHAGHEGTASLGAKDIGGGASALAEQVLDDAAEIGGHLAEEAGAGGLDLLDAVALDVGVSGRRHGRQLCRGGIHRRRLVSGPGGPAADNGRRGSQGWRRGRRRRGDP